MRQHHTSFLLCLTLFFGFLSCKKDTKPPTAPPAPRNVRYILYTTENFSDDNKLITFELVMKNGQKVLFDSTFASLKVSDIPFKTAAIVVNKAVPAGNENADLVVGFLYSIQDVGNSWFLDTAKAGNPLKIVEYAFK
jgi:hypothetical protein